MIDKHNHGGTIVTKMHIWTFYGYLMFTILFMLSDHFYFCYAINYTISEKAFYML